MSQENSKKQKHRSRSGNERRQAWTVLEHIKIFDHVNGCLFMLYNVVHLNNYQTDQNVDIKAIKILEDNMLRNSSDSKKDETG